MIYQLIATEEWLWVLCQECDDLVLVEQEAESNTLRRVCDGTPQAMIRIGEFIWVTTDHALCVWDVESHERVLRVDSNQKESICSLISLDEHSFATLSTRAIGIWHHSTSASRRNSS